jgi:proteasome lid subunit RPN8/RPN11
MRPKTDIIISDEIKDFVKNNKHPRNNLHYAIIGKKKKDSWILESLIKVDYPTTCPVGSKPLKNLLLKNKVIGMIHSHPGEKTIPSTHDLRRAPVNRVHIILGKGKPSIWFKHNNHIIELKIKI